MSRRGGVAQDLERAVKKYPESGSSRNDSGHPRENRPPVFPRPHFSGIVAWSALLQRTGESHSQLGGKQTEHRIRSVGETAIRNQKGGRIPLLDTFAKTLADQLLRNAGIGHGLQPAAAGEKHGPNAIDAAFSRLDPFRHLRTHPSGLPGYLRRYLRGRPYHFRHAPESPE